MKSTSNTILKITIVLLLLYNYSTFNSVSALTLSVHEIMSKSWWSTKVDGLEALSTLVIYNPKGQKRVKKIALISKLYDNGRTEKRLLRFLAPSDEKGTGVLTFDYQKKEDRIWLYMPSVRKTKRIAASEKSKNFMGSEFTYADITPPPVEDFQHKILRTEEINGINCWVVESIPNTEKIAEENGFSKRISYISQADYVVRKRIYFDLDQELSRVLVVHAVREIDPDNQRFYPTNMEMVNKQNNRRSILVADAIKYRTDIPDEYFSARYLERE